MCRTRSTGSEDGRGLIDAETILDHSGDGHWNNHDRWRKLKGLRLNSHFRVDKIDRDLVLRKVEAFQIQYTIVVHMLSLSKKTKVNGMNISIQITIKA
jgi:hypothetical protein